MPSLTRRSFLAAAAVAPLATTLRAAEEPKFKPGLVTYNVPKDWDLPTILRICKSAGLAAVECRTTHKHGVEPSLTKDERSKVKKQFADSGVVFWGCGSVCEFHAAEADVVKKNIEDCKRFLALVADLGGRGVKVRPNGVAKGHTVEQACTQIGKALQECGQAAKDLGLEIFVEVHGGVTQIPKNMKAILEVCNHSAVGACWNSNASDLENGKLDANFDLLKPHLKACHINDLENDAKGKYPYRQLFKRLKEIGYDRYTLCEVNKSFDPVAGEKYLKEYVAKWKELAT
jgi:sugar phosphate isomerase/epimerase